MVDLEIFDAYFREADLDNDGRISGAEAVPFFQRSNLPKQILAQIWFHVDQSRTGFLGRPEFYNALKLVTVVQSGRELTADIVKAALFGPANPKIPAPKINPAPASATQTNSVTMPPHLSSMVPPFTQTGATISASQESEFEEDDGLIIDTSAGKIELSNMQVLDDKDLVELQVLGSGGFGTVYRGKWKGTDVAIKRINNSCYTGQLYEDRLILDTFREAGLLASLHHPNIVSFYGFARDELKNTLAIVTELVVDGSLRNILFRKSKYLDYRKRLIIAMDAAFGMEYLHLSKIVHFDLKCANLLVDLKDPSKPICKVADFGLSKVKQDTLVSGGIRGTLPWMAPELLRGGRSKASEKVDVYSFGIVMWEILTGKLPYTGMFEGEIIGGIFNNKLRPPVPASCDSNWRKLMEECWASDPQKRPTFKQIAGRLHSMLVVNYAEAS